PRAGQRLDRQPGAVQASLDLIELGLGRARLPECRLDPRETGDPTSERLARRADRLEIGADAADGLGPVLEGGQSPGKALNFRSKLRDGDTQAVAELLGLFLQRAG